jgi:hypothetical protein
MLGISSVTVASLSYEKIMESVNATSNLGYSVINAYIANLILKVSEKAFELGSRKTADALLDLAHQTFELAATGKSEGEVA